jgi:hypothetical protein
VACRSAAAIAAVPLVSSWSNRLARHRHFAQPNKTNILQTLADVALKKSFK